MRQPDGARRLGTVSTVLLLSFGAALQAAVPPRVDPPATAAADTAHLSDTQSALENWRRAQQELRAGVWLTYAASTALGPDARGRTIDQDLREWVMTDEVRRRLQQIELQAEQQYRAGDSKAGEATLDSGRETYIDQSRRLRLINYYWGQKLYLDRQRQLFRSWLKQLPSSEAERSKAILRPLEERLTRDFGPRVSSETLGADVDALKQAYNRERSALARQVSEQREAAGSSFAGRDRHIPCPEVQADDSTPTPTASSMQDHSIQVIRAPSMERFYPPAARRADVTGRVLVQLSVGVTGCVEHEQITLSSGAPELDEAAMDLAEYYHFRAAQKNGRPVASRTALPVDFVLGDDAVATASPANAASPGAPQAPHELSSADLDSLIRRAEMDFFAGRHDQAVAESTEVLRLKPSAYPMYALRARIYRIRGETEKSLGEAHAATLANAQDAHAYTVAGEIYASSHDAAEASEAFDRAEQLAQDEHPYVTRAAYRPHTDLAGRQADVEAALKRNPRSVPALAMRAELQVRAHDFAAALASLNQALSIEGKQYGLLTQRGIVYMQSGQGKLAEQDFEAASALINPADHPIWLNNMCWRIATAGVALATALRLCDTADAHAPENYNILDSRGFVLLRLKRYPESIAAYDEALKIFPSGDSSLYGRGLAKRLTGKSDEGDADIRTALQNDATVAERFAGFGVRP